MAREFANKVPSKDFLTIKGLVEAERLFAYMASRKKNILVKQSYGYATKEYRAALRRNTPIGSEPKGLDKKGKPRKRLNQTIGFERSKKYANLGKLVEPVQVGNLNKKGGYHQHLVVRGRAAIKADGKKLQRGNGKRKSVMRFKAGGKNVFATKVKATKPKSFVEPVALQYKDKIANSFGDAFVKALGNEAKKILGKYYA